MAEITKTGKAGKPVDAEYDRIAEENLAVCASVAEIIASLNGTLLTLDKICHTGREALIGGIVNSIQKLTEAVAKRTLYAATPNPTIDWGKEAEKAYHSGLVSKREIIAERGYAPF